MCNENIQCLWRLLLFKVKHGKFRLHFLRSALRDPYMQQPACSKILSNRSGTYVWAEDFPAAWEARLGSNITVRYELSLMPKVLSSSHPPLTVHTSFLTSPSEFPSQNCKGSIVKCKCKMMPIGARKPNFTYMLMGCDLSITDQERAHGVVVGNLMKMSTLCVVAGKKA